MPGELKVALAQLNYKIGNLGGNSSKIVGAIEDAKAQNVDLIIFSELAITGYPPLDLLIQENFVKAAVDAISGIAKHCNGIAAIVGAPSINYNTKGKPLFNSAWFLNNGQATPVVHKTLLPTYDVFDEYRYFQPNKDFNILSFKGHRIAVTICEDIWDDRPVDKSFDRNHLYTLSPMQKLAALKPDMAVNIAASPFSYTQHETRRQVLCKKAAAYNMPLYYVNQTGANCELIFDGGSMVIDSKGRVASRLEFFKEQLFITDGSIFEKAPEEADADLPEGPWPKDIVLIHKALICGLRDYFQKSRLKKAVVGLSGGLDSAIVAALAAEALGSDNVHGLLMPSQYSSDHSISDAEALVANTGISSDIVPIKDIFKSFEAALEGCFKGRKADLTEENIQARIRGTLLMAYSNKFGHILLNTSNKSEAAVGYGTLYGDMAGGLSVVGDVYKSDLYRLAAYLNRDREVIPQNTITKAPSAELRPDQKDSDSLPEYHILDPILFRYIDQNLSFSEIVEQGFDKDLVARVLTMVNRNEHKRFQTPPVLRVSTKAFGPGRRMPLVAEYRLY